MGWPPRGLGRYPGALAIVVVATLAAETLYRTFDITRLSMIFLAGVLTAAVTLGSGPGYFAAVVAFVIYNFYLVEPRFTIEFASAEDVIVLAVFLIVAMLTGSLGGRVRDQAERAQGRARTTSALFHASQEFSSINDAEEIGERLARHIAQAAKGEALVAAAGKIWIHPANGAVPEGFVHDLTNDRGAVADTSAFDVQGWRARGLRAQTERLGFAAWRPAEARAPDGDEERLINVLVDLGATAMARARLANAQAEVQALAKTERLRVALLSSISHDLRTPLASILASASSLRDFGPQFDDAVRADLVLTIEEEAERLNRFVSNLLNMTKLESQVLAVNSAAFDVREVVDRVVGRFTARRDHRLVRQTFLEDGRVLGDPILFEQALGNVVDNAIRFSPEGSTISVELVRLEDAILIEISDQGPGVAPEELPRIFDKFYRAPSTTENLQGTGLGLSITKGLIEAMGGEVSARLGPENRGMIVTIHLRRTTEWA